MINKYSLNESKDFSAAVILHRAADIHLLYAEALNRLGETENALLILNDGYRTLPYWRSSQGIRGRVYLKSVELGPGSVEYVENLIMDERSMELAFEGKRWTDLMRIARRRNSPTYLVDRVSVKFLNTDDYWPVRNRLMDEENWYLPVY